MKTEQKENEQFVFETLEKTDDEDYYSNTYKHESESTVVTEDLYVYVLAPENGDKKDYTCNMCGGEVERSVCLHFVKDWEAKNDDGLDDVVEEEVILCQDCLDKLSKLLHKV